VTPTSVGHRRTHRLILSAIAGMAVVACGGTTAATTTPDPRAAAHLMTVDELAAGQLGSLPTGSQFERVAVFHQAPHQRIPSKKHQAGIVYVETGVQQLTYIGGQSVDVGAGTAWYLKSVEHSHTIIGPTDSTWYFMALWPSGQRSAPLVGGSQVAFETADIPSSVLHQGSYIETLRRVTLQSGGRSPAHLFGGFEVVFVLSGALTVKVAGNPSMQLIAGEGTSVVPGVATQEIAAGSSTVVYLAYFVTPVGAPFETAVTNAA
jgi:quercetin dioxygenase-like cupin family protein